ncbi:flagellar biosynthetic protein FliQ [Flavisphingomonas formosensis]|uniref:flagellar biosynthetic protein FliQ n=1 Tax=Flavisphingomonas formosensis TaxID=861534 RepID=UPI001E5A00B9|nr:flagellar biosynthetic protein FliQ [Sphingomonas formosensis]
MFNTITLASASRGSMLELGHRGNSVDGDKALGLMNALLWNSLVISGPILIAALVTGLVISVLQVATQLQEMTLSYVPKLFVCALMLALLGPWLLARLTQFAITMIALIPQLG